MSGFTDALLDEVLNARDNYYTDNFDEVMRYDARYQNNHEGVGIITKLLNKYVPISYRLTASRTLFNILNPAGFYRPIVKQFEQVSFLYQLLDDQASKNLLIKLFAYKILGHEKVKLPRNCADYWRGIETLRQLDTGADVLKIKFIDLQLKLLDLNSLGYPLKIYGTPEGAAAIFKQKQYEYHGAETVKVVPGDVVMDCGACWGETSLYFANEADSNGSVYSFEFIDANIDVFNKNLSNNPNVSDRIHLVKHPVWDKSNEALTFADNGPGSSVLTGPSSHTGKCMTISIDDLVKKENIDQVHFIKMDIEGSELRALQGAINTIKKDKPKLAISLYHKDEDFVDIPAFLSNLNLGYRFYLEHHTIHYWETVLFAIASPHN